MGRGFHIGDGYCEPTVLKGNGNQLKNGYHRHHAIVFVGQDTTQHDAKHHAYQLQGDVAHRPPKYTFCRFLFECLCHPQRIWLQKYLFLGRSTSFLSCDTFHLIFEDYNDRKNDWKTVVPLNQQLFIKKTNNLLV